MERHHRHPRASARGLRLTYLALVSLPCLLSCDGNPRECESSFRSTIGAASHESATEGVCIDTPGAYKYCESYGGGQGSTSAAGTKWVVAQCPGFEPVCNPVPAADGYDEMHICRDAFVGEPCKGIEVVPAPGASRSSSSDYMAGDIDKDGDLDLLFAVRETTGSSLWLVEQVDPLNFSAPRLLTLYEGEVWPIFVGELDGEGWADIVMRASQSMNAESVGVLLFPDQAAELFEMDVEILSLVDVDGDGLAEAVGADDTSLLLYSSIWPNLEAPQVVPVNADVDWYRARWGLFGGDNRRDLVIGFDDQDTGLLVADDSGFTLVWTGNATLANFDGDGVADAFGGGTVTLGVGADGIGRVPVEVRVFPDGFFPWLLGDVDGDGNTDIVRTSRLPAVRPDPAGGRVAIALGQGEGRFAPATIYDLADSYFNPIALIDMDADGRAELLGVMSDGSVLMAPATCQAP